MMKTVTFAIMHFMVAFAVAYALTGDLVVGGAVALVEPAVNTVAYHLHERLWSRVRPPASGVAEAKPVSPGGWAACCS